MTKPTIESVATMQGRELDAAIHRLVIGHRQEWHEWGTSAVPHYSTDPAAFFAVMDKVREAGWEWESHHSGEKVVLYGHGRTLYGYGDTMPLAFARAALMTTYSKEQS